MIVRVRAEERDHMFDDADVVQVTVYVSSSKYYVVQILISGIADVVTVGCTSQEDVRRVLRLVSSPDKNFESAWNPGKVG